MKRLDVNAAWGVLLIALGVLFLLQSLGFLGEGIALLWALLFAAGGAVFLYVFLRNPANWWAVIPGFALLGLGVLITLGSTGSELVRTLGGALFMAGIGAAFGVIYLRNHEFWWAVIPAGVLFTLALVILLSSWVEGAAVGSVFFLGLAATFSLVWLLPNPKGRMTWALIPAAVLAVIGALTILASVELLRFLWPAALILVGVYFVYRALVSLKAE